IRPASLSAPAPITSNADPNRVCVWALLLPPEKMEASGAAEPWEKFVDWMTEPTNFAKFSNKKSGQKIEEAGEEWSREKVKSKIQYGRKKYDMARALLDETGQGVMDETALRAAMLTIIPEYDRLDAVYRSSSLVRNSLPRSHTIPVDERSDDSGDDDKLGPSDSSHQGHQASVASSTTSKTRKRSRRDMGSTMAVLLDRLESLQEQVRRAQDDDESMIARFLEREKSIEEIFAKRAKEQDDMFKRRLQHLLDERDEIKREKDELCRIKNGLETKITALREDRDRLWAENIRLRTEQQKVIVPPSALQPWIKD
ncbi:hypothetical protein BGZ73_004292, partial [Actinomortierella ambigua]